MSGFVVEVRSPSGGLVWLAESDGTACVVSAREYAKVFATLDDAREAAERYTFLHSGHVASWADRPK